MFYIYIFFLFRILHGIRNGSDLRFSWFFYIYSDRMMVKNLWMYSRDFDSSLKSHLSICWKAIRLTGYPRSPLFSHKIRCGPRELQNGGRWSLAARASEISALLRSLNVLSIHLLDLQSLGTDEGVKMLVKTLFFYIAITLEAFIFCFAGEYLSNKVSIWNHLSEVLLF